MQSRNFQFNNFQNNSSTGFSPMLVKTFDNELKSKENLVLRRDNNIYTKTITNTQNFRNPVNNYFN
jgi:hypothetical protein